MTEQVADKSDVLMSRLVACAGFCCVAPEAWMQIAWGLAAAACLALWVRSELRAARG